MDHTGGIRQQPHQGWEASLEWAAPALNRAASVSYYGGLRRSDLRMAGYTEDNAVFPSPMPTHPTA